MPWGLKWSAEATVSFNFFIFHNIHNRFAQFQTFNKTFLKYFYTWHFASPLQWSITDIGRKNREPLIAQNLIFLTYPFLSLKDFKTSSFAIFCKNCNITIIFMSNYSWKQCTVCSDDLKWNLNWIGPIQAKLANLLSFWILWP